MLVFPLLMQPDFRLMLEGFLQLANLFLEITQMLIEFFLFLLQFLCVELLALSGIESVSVSVGNVQDDERKVIRSLPVSQESFLLFQLLLLLLISSLENQRVNVGQVPFRGYLKSCILLPDAISSELSSWRRSTIVWAFNGPRARFSAV